MATAVIAAVVVMPRVRTKHCDKSGCDSLGSCDKRGAQPKKTPGLEYKTPAGCFFVERAACRRLWDSA